MRKPIVLLSVLLIVLSVAVPASAEAPVITVGPVVYDFAAFDCGDYWVWDHVDATARVKWFYDDNGNPIKAMLNYQTHEYVYNPAAPDKIAEAYGALHITTTWDEDGMTHDVWEGTMWKVTLPGYGAVAIEAGRWSSDTGQVGRTVSAEGLQALCTYFRVP